MDGADDLAAIDALQVDASDPKIGVPIMRMILSSAACVAVGGRLGCAVWARVAGFR